MRILTVTYRILTEALWATLVGWGISEMVYDIWNVSIKPKGHDFLY